MLNKCNGNERISDYINSTIFFVSRRHQKHCRCNQLLHDIVQYKSTYEGIHQKQTLKEFRNGMKCPKKKTAINLNRTKNEKTQNEINSIRVIVKRIVS